MEFCSSAVPRVLWGVTLGIGACVGSKVKVEGPWLFCVQVKLFLRELTLVVMTFSSGLI